MLSVNSASLYIATVSLRPKCTLLCAPLLLPFSCPSVGDFCSKRERHNPLVNTSTSAPLAQPTPSIQTGRLYSHCVQSSIRLCTLCQESPFEFYPKSPLFRLHCSNLVSFCFFFYFLFSVVAVRCGLTSVRWVIYRAAMILLLWRGLG